MQFQKSNAVVALIFLTLLCGNHLARAADANPELNFVPWPESVKATGGELSLPATGHVVATDESLVPLAKIVSDELYLLIGVRVTPTSGTGNAGDIVLKIDSKIGPEAAYTVIVDDRVTITGGAYLGAAHGTSLLSQAVKAGKNGISLPRIMVQDKPYSEYYGQLVDLARQNNSMDELKGVINMMRLYRLRFLQLHMTDDQAWTFPSTAFPNLGKSNQSTRGGPVPKVYTVEQWKDLVRYADERGVTLVPEIETAGHSDAARRDAPEVFGPDVAVLNMTNPKMYPALDTIIGEVCDVFKSSPYIHIGCDECNFEPVSRDENSGAFRKAHGITDGNDLFAWHIAKMNEIVKKHGKRTIAWQDGAFTDRVPKDVIVMVWHIEGDNGETPALISEGRQVIQVTWTPCVYQPVKDVYEWNAWKKEWPQGGNMLGGQLVLWELSGSSAVPFLRYKSAPRGERIRNPYAALPYQNFAKRFESTDLLLDRLLTGVIAQESGLTMTLGDWLRAGGQGNEGSGILPKFSIDDHSTVAFESAVPGAAIHFTTDGSEPTAASPLYAAPAKLYDGKSDKVTVNARAFDNAGHPIGTVWTRDYYFKPIAGSISGTLLPEDRISEPATITLTSSMKGQIRYSLDGKEPTEASTAYTVPITINKSANFVAGLFIDGKLTGELWRQNFVYVAFVKNLTTHKPVTASGVQDGCPPENAVDGIVDLHHAWWAGPWPQWIKVDLETVVKLDSAEVFPYWDGSRYYQYNVEVSTDDKNWIQVVDMSTNTRPARPEGDLHHFKPIDARYVRVNMLKNSANEGVHLVELRVFAAK